MKLAACLAIGHYGAIRFIELHANLYHSSCFCFQSILKATE